MVPAKRRAADSLRLTHSSSFALIKKLILGNYLQSLLLLHRVLGKRGGYF